MIIIVALMTMTIVTTMIKITPPDTFAITLKKMRKKRSLFPFAVFLGEFFCFSLSF